MLDEFSKKEYENREYVGVQYLVSSLNKRGIKNKFVNAHAYRIDTNVLCDDILSLDVAFVGISSHSQKGFPAVRELFQELRKRGYSGHICLGGFYASLNFEEIMQKYPEVTTILIGEGEYSLPELIVRLEEEQDIKDISGIVYRNGNEIISSVSKRILNLDELDFPQRDVNIITDDQNGRSFSVVSGRGCYGRCNFCCKGIYFDNNYKVYRNHVFVVDEIEQLINQYDVKNFSFADEIFYDDNGHDWVINFVDELKNRNLNIKFDMTLRVNDVKKELIEKLASVGLKRVSVGVESAVPRILNEMNKKITIEQSINALNIITECGVKAKLTFITFIPTMSFEELKTNYNFLFSLDNDMLSEGNLYNRLSIFSGCEYEAILREKELLWSDLKDFAERHTYNYLDRKVECFVYNITKVRKYLAECKKAVLEKNDYSDRYLNLFEETKKQSKFLCKEIIKDLLLIVEFLLDDELEVALNKFHEYTKEKVNLHKLKMMQLFD